MYYSSADVIAIDAAMEGGMQLLTLVYILIAFIKEYAFTDHYTDVHSIS